MKNRSIYAAMKQGVLLCDERARIIYFNDSFSRFAGIRLKDAKGRYMPEIKPDSVVPRVIETGIASAGMLHSDNGRDYVADVSPVIEDGKVVGSVTVINVIENIQLFKSKMNQLERDQQMLSARLSKINGTTVTFRDMVYAGKIMDGTIETARNVARLDIPILISGESGTGKNVFAQAIHNESARREAPFVAVNCGTLGKLTLESELFGYEEGAFGGETAYGKAGLLEIAAGGTLFLDEVSEMDIELQWKLLHVLQERRVRRIGSTRDIPLDVRVISACHVDPERCIQEHQLLNELYQYLSACHLHIPPLREHPEDIPVLTDYFLKMNRLRHKRDFTIDAETRDILNAYCWPDNVRELKNVIATITASAEGGVVTPMMLPRHILNVVDESSGRVRTLSERVREVEREEIGKMLRRYGENTDGKRKAAKALGISLATLYNKLGQ